LSLDCPPVKFLFCLSQLWRCRDDGDLEDERKRVVNVVIDTDFKAGVGRGSRFLSVFQIAISN
jgi:hypothetical protein